MSEHRFLLAIFFSHDTCGTAICTLSLHDALPISPALRRVLGQLVRYANTTTRGGAPLARDPLVRRRLAAMATELAALRLLDRKSTRLNSSHVEISYAVFCLKKKTRIPPQKA